MERHTKRENKREMSLKIFHISNIVLFTALSAIGFKYFFVSITAFVLMIMKSMGVYLYGLIGIRTLVKRFQLTFPNERVTCIHFTNMTFFVILVVSYAISEILLLQMYTEVDREEVVKNRNEIAYLRRD